MTEKYCNSCKNTKSVSEFYVHIRNSTGYSSTCMDCHREVVRKAEKTPHGKELVSAKSRRMYIKHQRKWKARSAVRYAIKTGKVIKPKQCESCDASRPLQAHHNDYSKPFEVQFYCDPCHKLVHRKLVDKSLLFKQGILVKEKE